MNPLVSSEAGQQGRHALGRCALSVNVNRVALLRNGQAVETGSGANVLDSPLRALHHFLGELRQCPGAPDLLPGDVVTTGTWTDAWPIAAGEAWQANFSAPLPALAVEFVGEPA